MPKIQIGDLEKAISKELSLYDNKITQKAKDASDDVMKELVKNTKNDAPKKSGKYKRAITSDTTFENTRVKINTWYVKAPHYRLSHLLERGHQTRNGGRTRAFHFIEKNEKIAVKNYEKKIEEAIEDGY